MGIERKSGTFVKGHTPWNKGIKCPQISEVLRHRVLKPETLEKYRNKRLSESTKEKIRQANIGEKSPRWKGGITPIHLKIRRSTQYRRWRIEVLERDNYTCVECGSKGVALQVDHIKPFAYYPELRLIIDNGRTLCVPCHKATDTYGTNPIKEQIKNEHKRQSA